MWNKFWIAVKQWWYIVFAMIFMVSAFLGPLVWMNYKSPVVVAAPEQLVQAKPVIDHDWLNSTYLQYKARVDQIQAGKMLVAQEKKRAERKRIEGEMSHIRQDCKDITQRYNTRTGSIEPAELAAYGVPTTLDSARCK